MNQNFDIAKAYLIEANSDFDVVSLLIENNKFSKAVFHAQQAVEKLQKAAAEGEIWIYMHEILSFFLHSFKNKIEIETMALLPLEENCAMSKYPDWKVKRIWIPPQQFVSLSDRIQNIQIKLFPASSSQSVFHHGGVQ